MAKDLLATSDKNVTEIAHMTGFGSQGSLSRYFKKAYGSSPSTFKKESNKSLASIRELPPQLRVAKDSNRIGIGVLTFKDLSNDVELSYFGDGMAEEINYGLSKIKGFRLAGRISSNSLKDSTLGVEEIGKRLKVDYILDGSMQRIGGRMKVNVSLVKASDGFLIWSERYLRESEDIFALQDEIAKSVVRNLANKLTDNSDHSIDSRHKTNSVEAYKLYLQGRRITEQRIHLNRALACYYRAISLDSDFGHAYIGIAYTQLYSVIFEGASSEACFPKISDALGKAEELLGDVHEVFMLKGWYSLYFDHDINKAITKLNEAIRQQPNEADYVRLRAYLSAFKGNFKEAINFAYRAHQLEPLSFNTWLTLGDMYVKEGRYGDALQLFYPLLQKYPDVMSIYEYIGMCHYHNGDFDKAAAIFCKPAPFPHLMHQLLLHRYVFNYYHGDESLLQDLVNHILNLEPNRVTTPCILALAYFHLGQEDKAVEMLHFAEKTKDFMLLHMRIDMLWAPFWYHPEVLRILHKVGTPPPVDPKSIPSDLSLFQRRKV